MRVGIATSHLYSMGGGYQAVKWHALACQKLGHSVTVFTRNIPSQEILQNWPDGIVLRQYWEHCEAGFDVFINIDHFTQSFPEAKLNIAHVFFPMESTPPPSQETIIYSNSAYTAQYIQRVWNRVATPFYIPIDNHFYSSEKDRVIVHVSRFTKSTEWADKAHEQMIQAFKSISRKMPGWKFVLAGSIDPYMNFHFTKLARLGAGYEIDLMPNLSNKSLADLYSRAAIYWHATGVDMPNVASAQEHLGVTPIEAQASGCVPIAFNSGGIPEVVIDRQTGLLFDNVAHLPEMTLELSKNLTAWAQLSQAAQIWAKSWKDFGAFIQRTDDMLNGRSITPLKPFQMELSHSPSEVTIVIPTYNSKYLEQCLDSLEKTAPEARVFVVNNGEPLSNLRVYNNVEILEAGHNLGFAGAHRVAAQIVKTPFVLMLNDDIVANRPNWLEQLLFVMNNDEVGVVGAKLYFPDGNLQFAGGIVDFLRDDIGYHRDYGMLDSLSVSTPSEVDFVTGAALLCRRELYSIPDYLMEGLNMEDTDICFTARARGYKVVYQPASSLIHYEGETKRRAPESEEKVERNRAAFRQRWQK